MYDVTAVRTATPHRRAALQARNQVQVRMGQVQTLLILKTQIPTQVHLMGVLNHLRSHPVGADDAQMAIIENAIARGALDLQQKSEKGAAKRC